MVVIELQGLVIDTSKNYSNNRDHHESTKINIDDATNVDLSNIYLTFDSIYMVKPTSSHRFEPYVFDFAINRFQLLDHQPCSRLVAFSSNTNYFWALGVVTNDDKHGWPLSQFTLFQYSNRHVMRKLDISLNEPTLITSLDDLVIQSTDVNVYVFENSEKGLRCLYQLRKQADLDENQTVKENQLNESSTSCLPVNKLLLDQKVAQFASGKEHILFLTQPSTPSSSGRLYSFGLGTKGQLGLGKIENRYELALVHTPPDLNIRSISAGGWHSAFLADNGECYLWGWNLNGQVSMAVTTSTDNDNDSVFVVSPAKLRVTSNLTDVKFRAVSLGSRHSAVLDLDGNVYMFGWNKYGQIEAFDENDEASAVNDVEMPVRIHRPTRVSSLKCGCWSTVFVTAD